jgi:parallel beta-helix repeat protein
MRRHVLCLSDTISTLGVLVLGACSLSTAQPSGGPYGPVGMTYKLPEGAKKIYYVAVDGNPKQSGETLAQPTTIETAIEHARTGDVIIMRGGEYRTGNLVLNQGITIQPYANEKPVFKGTKVATDWVAFGDGLWTTKWSTLFPSRPESWWKRYLEAKKTPPYLFNDDMVFVDGEFLNAVGWEGEVNEHSYYIDYEAGVVYIGINPKDRLVEITAHDVSILRTTKKVHGTPSDHKGYTLRGITFTQYATRILEIEGTEPEGISPESQHGKEVVGTTIENCTISFCSRRGASLRGDRLTMSHCRVSDTSTEGVYIIASNDVLLEKNIFTRNNIERITGYYPAAVKIFNQSHRVTCRDNLVTDLPYSNGIWYDVGNVDGVFVNNWIQNVGMVRKTFATNYIWPSDNGFYFEISKGVICAGNVFVNCDHGLTIYNSSNARIYNNTFVNSTACIGRTSRSAVGDHFGWHPSTGPDVDKREGHVFVNNLLTGDAGFARPLLFAWQESVLCNRLTSPQLKQMDHNVYVREWAKAPYPLILWSPAGNEQCQEGYATIAEMQKAHPEFAKNSRFYADYTGPMFKGALLNNYRTVTDFPASGVGTTVPKEISAVVPSLGSNGPYIGAYPPLR